MSSKVPEKKCQHISKYPVAGLMFSVKWATSFSSAFGKAWRRDMSMLLFFNYIYTRRRQIRIGMALNQLHFNFLKNWNSAKKKKTTKDQNGCEGLGALSCSKHSALLSKASASSSKCPWLLERNYRVLLISIREHFNSLFFLAPFPNAV